MAKSDYLEAQHLDDTFRSTARTRPAAVWLGLLTAAPSDAGGGIEVSGNNYGRVQIVQDDTSWTAPDASTGISNEDTVQFATPSGSWGTVTHAGYYDAETDGNLLYWTALSAALVVGSGADVHFGPGDLTVKES